MDGTEYYVTKIVEGLKEDAYPKGVRRISRRSSAPQLWIETDSGYYWITVTPATDYAEPYQEV